MLNHIIIPMPKLTEALFRFATRFESVRAKLPNVTLYSGPWGKHKASLRKLDEAKSTPSKPFHAMNEFQYLRPGEVVPVDISLWPIGMHFRPGEQLSVQIAGFNMRGPFLPTVKGVANENRGTHIIHTGGRFDSHILLPFLSKAS